MIFDCVTLFKKTNPTQGRVAIVGDRYVSVMMSQSFIMFCYYSQTLP